MVATPLLMGQWILHCVTTADSTHIEDYTKFYCCHALALLLCARICNCWNFLSSPFVLPVPCNWWTKYQFHNISICQTKPSIDNVYPPKLLLYTQICVLNKYCESICTNCSVHILVKSKTIASLGCFWHFLGVFSGDLGVLLGCKITRGMIVVVGKVTERD